MKVSRNVVNYIFAAGSLSQLSQVLSARRGIDSGKALVFVDHYFQGKDQFLRDQLDLNQDKLIYVNTTDEPTTEMIDDFMVECRASFKNVPSAIVGMGGGCTLDVAKAVSNLFTNGGKAEDYQGWDLICNEGVFKIGIPTISGTGAESSRTCVLMNYRKNLKLGMNSHHTVYDMLILDPNLTESVPSNQYFYTGMDTYIHCVESLNGRYRNAIGDAFSREALQLCEEVFLGQEMKSSLSRERLMVASYLGGCAIANSYVGLVHPLSAGLSMVLGLHHCIANCIVMNVLDEYYPSEHAKFKEMLTKQNIRLPQNITKGLSDKEFEDLYSASIIHEKPLANALGDHFKEVLTLKKVCDLFERM